jgi:hypothetical protein
MKSWHGQGSGASTSDSNYNLQGKSGAACILSRTGREERDLGYTGEPGKGCGEEVFGGKCTGFPYCAHIDPLPLLPSGPGGVGGNTSRRTRHMIDFSIVPAEPRATRWGLQPGVYI